jgi:DHA1 family bicyclomycin/chloramphenicol resistance-like MFS transporter
VKQPDPTGSHPPPAVAGWKLLVLLTALSSVGPLSINLMVPALPGIAASLAADPGTVQLTVSLYFVGLAFAQLVLGTLSDRFGRRPVLLAGFALTVVTSFAALAATNITHLVIARTAQALGASTGLVISRAIVRDLYTRDRAASMLAWVTMSLVLIPMFGSVIGGFLDVHWGWRSIFVFLGVASLVMLAWAVWSLPETRSSSSQAVGWRQFWRECLALLRTPAFAGYALCTGMISGPFYTVLGGAPHIIVNVMGRSSLELGIWFALPSLGYMAGNFLAARYSVRFGVHAMLLWGLLLEVVAALVWLALIPVWPGAGPLIIFGPLLVLYVGNGMALPNAIAGALSVRPQAAGTASGVTGFVQMGVGAVITQLITYAVATATDTLPLALPVLLQGVVGVLLFWFLVRPSRSA